MRLTSIKLKSLKEPTEKSDGLRILIARFRPRYLRKEEENWDEWWKELAPSKILWKEYFKDKKIDWDEYSRRYKTEILDNPQAINALHKLTSFNYIIRPSINNKNGYDNNDNLQDRQRIFNLDQSMTTCDTVTLLCHCRDEHHCHRSIVKELVKGI